MILTVDQTRFAATRALGRNKVAARDVVQPANRFQHLAHGLERASDDQLHDPQGRTAVQREFFGVGINPNDPVPNFDGSDVVDVNLRGGDRLDQTFHRRHQPSRHGVSPATPQLYVAPPSQRKLFNLREGVRILLTDRLRYVCAGSLIGFRRGLLVVLFRCGESGLAVTLGYRRAETLTLKSSAEAA